MDVREIEFFGESEDGSSGGGLESLRLVAEMSEAGLVLIVDDGDQIDFSWPNPGDRIYVRREPFACFVVRGRS